MLSVLRSSHAELSDIPFAMKKKALKCVAVIIMLCCIIWIGSGLFNRSASKKNEVRGTSPSPPTLDPLASSVTLTGSSNHPDEDLLLRELYATPIIFYGKVVDENGSPIDLATANIQINDHFMGKGTIYSKLSDENGRFSIEGVKGLGLNVSVSKLGYHTTPDSTVGLGYAKGTTATGIVVRFDNPLSPKIFVLRKAGKIEPLVIRSWNVKLSKFGEPVFLDLNSGRGSRIDSTLGYSIKIQLSVISRPGAEESKNHYEWHWMISVPEGGIQTRTDQVNYTAPLEGYKASEEILMQADDPHWNSWTNVEYYVKFSNNDFARISFSIIPGGDNFVTGQSYLNNRPTHQSLEILK